MNWMRWWNAKANQERWESECLRWRGAVLTGKYAHYCFEFDGLPVDETSSEIAVCCCFDSDEFKEISEAKAKEITDHMGTDCWRLIV